MLRQLLAVVVIAVVGCGTPKTTSTTRSAQNSRATTLPTTQSSAAIDALTIDLDIPITPRRSLVWCASMQIAWDHLGETMGGPVEIDGDPPSAVAMMVNRFPKKWIDSDAIVAEVGEPTEKWIDQLEATVRTKFGTNFVLDPNIWAAMRELSNGIVSYCAIYLRLPFETAFSAREIGFDVEREDFGDTEAVSYEAFGISADEAIEESMRPVVRQVKVCWFDPKEREFVIELKTRRPDQHLLLSRVSQPVSLRSAITLTMNRYRTQNTHNVDSELVYRQITEKADATEAIKELFASNTLGPGESLTVPVINIDLLKDFTDLKHRLFTSPEKMKKYIVAFALQSIRFRLDRTGAELQSEAALGGLFGGGPREFEFDQPFLLLVVHENSPWPFLAVWVGDDTFLVKKPPESTDTKPTTRTNLFPDEPSATTQPDAQ